MRERALEMDSHQECIGSLWFVEEVVVVVVVREALPFWRWRYAELPRLLRSDEEVVEEEGEPPGMWWRKSIPSVGFVGGAQ